MWEIRDVVTDKILDRATNKKAADSLAEYFAFRLGYDVEVVYVLE